MVKVANITKNEFCLISRILSCVLLLFIIVFATLAFGCVRPNNLFIVQVSILMCLLIQIPLFLFDARKWKNLPKNLWIAIAFFFGFLTLVGLQYKAGLRILDDSPIGSINRFATFESLVQLIFYFIFFLLCINTFQSRKLVERTLSFLCLFMFFTALFAVIQKLSDTDKIYWVFDSGGASFFGPFIYENNFGAFIALTLPMAVFLISWRYRKTYKTWVREQRKKIATLVIDLANAGVFFLFFVVVFTMATLFFSQARAAALVITPILVLTLLTLSLRKKNVLLFAVVLMSVVGFFGFATALNPNAPFENYNIGYPDFQERLQIIHDSLNIFTERSIFGFGLGTYYFIAPKYMTIPHLEAKSPRHPNNDYVELLDETGAMGFALVGLSLIMIFIGTLRVFRKERSFWSRSIVLQSLFSLGVLALLIPFESHLRIPSIALLFIFQLSLLANSSYQAGDDTGKMANGGTSNLPSRRRLSWTSRLVVIAILGLAACLFKYANDRHQAYAYAHDTADLLSKNPKAISLEPDNPMWWQEIAKVHYQKSLSVSDPTETRRHHDKAIHAMSQALQLCPTFAHYWFAYGQFEYLHGDKQKGIEALEKALFWSPNNRSYGLYLLSAYLSEREKVASPVRQKKYLEQARNLLLTLDSLKYPPSEKDFRKWMFNYKDETIQMLRSLN